MIYFDTSAVLPYYREEQASNWIQALLESQTRPVLISHLTEVEFASALARWVRMGNLASPRQIASKVRSMMMSVMGASPYARSNQPITVGPAIGSEHGRQT